MIQWVVVMVEPGKKLTVTEQINEVFGPFDTEKEAEDWSNRAYSLYKGLKQDRRWLIIPLSDSSCINAFDPTMG